jgi:hypothetical protein
MQNEDLLLTRMELLKKEISEIASTDSILTARVIQALVLANLKTAHELEQKDENEEGHGIRLFTQHMVKYCLGLIEDDEDEQDLVITDKMEKLLEVAHIYAPTYARFFFSSLNAINDNIERFNDTTERNIMQYYIITLVANVSCVHKAIERKEFYTEA